MKNIKKFCYFAITITSCYQCFAPGGDYLIPLDNGLQNQNGTYVGDPGDEREARYVVIRNRNNPTYPLQSIQTARIPNTTAVRLTNQHLRQLRLQEPSGSDVTSQSSSRSAAASANTSADFNASEQLPPYAIDAFCAIGLDQIDGDNPTFQQPPQQAARATSAAASVGTPNTVMRIIQHNPYAAKVFN